MTRLGLCLCAWALLAAAVIAGIVRDGHAHAQHNDPPAEPAKDVAAREAENEQLKAEVARQRERIAALEARLRGLERDAARRGGENANRPARPKRVAYVLDLSGSMDTKWPLVREEVTKAVGNLDPGATFDVVLGADEETERFHPGPVNPTPAALAALHQFLQARRTEGVTSLIEPMEEALAHKPEVIWLVTDGDMPNNKLFLERVAKANIGKRTRVNVVFATDGRRLPAAELNRDMVVFLQKVAADNGGKLFGMNGDVVKLEALPEWEPQPVGGWRDDAPPRFKPIKIPRGRTIFQE